MKILSTIRKNSPAYLCDMQPGFHDSQNPGLVQSVYEFFGACERDPDGAIFGGVPAGSDRRREADFREKNAEPYKRKEVA